TAEIKAFCHDKGIEVVGTIPFDPVVTEAMVQGQSVTAYHPEAPASQALGKIWTEITTKLMGDE
ncbi:MAG: (4Fe-4S)-binding protein, partial [Chloroflexota bacterium]